MMKKTIALLLMLCMVLCAGSALAVTLNFEDNNSFSKSGEVDAGTYKLPTPEELGMQKPAWAKEFFGWYMFTDQLYHQPGETVALTGEFVRVVGYWTSDNTVLIEYLPGTGEGTKKIFPNEREGWEQLTYPSICDFTSSKPFKAWQVEGNFKKESDYNFGEEVGRLLFARAIAEEQIAQMQPEESIQVLGPEKITVTALWGDEGGNIGNGNGGNNGGNNNGGANNGGAGSLPKTGDNSSLVLWLALVALCGVAMIALRKRAHN